MDYTLIKDILVPFGAAFAGAYFAYLWQSRQQNNQLKEQELLQCANVYITLCNQLELIAKTAVFLVNNIDFDKNEIGIQELKIGTTYNVDEASISFIAINDINTFVSIKEANTASHLFVDILNRYNSEVTKNNGLLSLRYMGKLLFKTNEMYEHFISTQVALKKYVKQNHKTKNFIDIEIKDDIIDLDKVRHASEIIKDKYQQDAQRLGILLNTM